MRVNNSAELAELIQQVVMMMNKHGTVVLIHEDVSFSDFEKETFQVAENLWQSFEAGTLDISDSNAPSNDDLLDWFETVGAT